MQVFKDKNQTPWELELTAGSVLRIKAHCQIDLGNIISFSGDDKKEGTLDRLGNDVALLCSVLWLLCEKQAESKNLDQAGFFDLLDGDAVEAAADALIDEIINFSRPAQRKVLRKLRELSREAEKNMEKSLETILESPEFEKELNGTLSDLSGSLPASSE